MVNIYLYHRLFILLVWLGLFDTVELFTIGSFPEELYEASGIVAETDSTFWVINDSGNNPNIYLVSYKGDILSKKIINNVVNTDWEDLTSDNDGNIYIGDFGDNLQNRKDYSIIKLNKADLELNRDSMSSLVMPFLYSTNISYDAEAFVYFDESLYLFTKNREEPFDGITNLFKLKIGDSIAVFKDKTTTYTDIKELSWITSAALSPNNKTLILLGSDKMFVFYNFENDNFFNGTMKIVSLETVTQKESITFISNTEVIITDEMNMKIGGKLYYVDLSEIE